MCDWMGRFSGGTASRWKSRSEINVRRLAAATAVMMNSPCHQDRDSFGTISRTDIMRSEACPQTRKDYRGVDLISDVMPFGRLWYDGPNAASNAVSYATHYSRSHDAVIRVWRVDQLCVKVAVSVMGPPIVIEAGLFVPVKEPVPLPVELVN